MLKLPAIFGDHMVLQRGKNIAVWGETDADTVLVRIAETCVEARIGEGKFEALLPPVEAGGPYRVEVQAGSDKRVYQDVMVGEVWLAGGQSNMELQLQNSENGSEVVKNARNDKIRSYNVPQVAWVGEPLYEAEEKSGWDLCVPEKVGTWSAVGYYFAEELSAKLGVTVGIIGCNWGGTSASCWVSREALEQNRIISSYIEEYDRITENQDEEEYIKAREAYLVYQAEFDKNVGHYYETAENPTWEEALRLCGECQYPGPMGPRTELRPCGLYESMLQRVCPYTLAGFLYYQGEEDDHKPYTYFSLLSALVRQWRKDWRDDCLPFLLVQLPMFQNGGDEPDYQNWPFVREAQMRLYQSVKNTGIAVILDQGEFGNIHPVRKDQVGYRLAWQALYQVYRAMQEEEVFGPIYRTYRVSGSQMILTFDHVQAGWKCTHEEITGFEVAGEDRVYYPAQAQIDGEDIVISSPEVPKPVYGRYCWTNYRLVTLFGANGIPAAPFRTDRGDGAVATGSRNGWDFSKTLPAYCD